MNVSQPKASKQTIDDDDDGQRIDNYLIKHMKGLPKSRIYRALRSGEVRVNGGRIKPDYRLSAGEEVRIPPLRVSAPKQRKAPDEQLTESLESRILFENDQMLVIDKPAGMPVHGGTKVNSGVIEWLRLLRPKAKRLELVHRLDRDTSGCVLVAKNRTTLVELQRQFAEREVDKIYHAVVLGQYKGGKRLVDARLLRQQTKEGARKVVISPEGKTAYTELKPVRVGQRFSLIEARLLTGRMHQIRVHCASEGLPIIGDPRYGDWDSNRSLAKRGVKRMLLHASRISIALNGKSMTFEATLPTDFEAIFSYDDQSLSD
ncbi:MAG: RluA family pseudouridine synthase [Coxiellaceae bacterium]|nr:RluA family pseudouridine synthase [Coxiellaceae bacterium]